MISDKNIDPAYVYVLLSYTWVAPALFFSMYIGWELLVPKIKWALAGIYIVLGIIFEMFLWFTPNQSFDHIKVQIEDGLIDAGFNMSHPTYLLNSLLLMTTLIFLGAGFTIKARQAKGLLRRRFTFLSIGFYIFFFCGVLDSILTLPLAIGLVRVIMITYPLWQYLGLKS